MEKYKLKFLITRFNRHKINLPNCMNVSKCFLSVLVFLSLQMGNPNNSGTNSWKDINFKIICMFLSPN